ncbi:MAG: corrinoid protein [Thermodesulfobacteriota bacterium]|nr:corrinoid protein [Thermodesulfobacteriota bacterium]
MGREKNEILSDLAKAVVEMDDVKTVELSTEALDSGVDAYEAIGNGLSKGMELVSEKYENGKYYVTETLLCSDAMYAGIEVLKPHIKVESVKLQGKIVIGVVEGDNHDLGKNLVKIMFEAARFEVHDLGRDVTLKLFVDKAQEVQADIIAMSNLMTTTMDGMEDVIAMLNNEGLRDRFKVMVGGCPISQVFADQIGADGYAPNASSAVRKAEELLALVDNTVI